MRLRSLSTALRGVAGGCDDRRGTMQIDRVTGLTILGAALGATLILAAYGQADVPA